MTFLHTADWHLGNTFHGHNREQEHAHFLAWLLEILQKRQPDALLISGDIFDSPNPSATAEGMFFKFLHDATETVQGLQIVVTAGNHDSGGRLEAPEALLKAHNVYVRGTIRKKDDNEPDYEYYLLPLSRRNNTEAETVVLALPYLRSGDYPPQVTQEEGLKLFFQNLYKALKKSPFRNLPTLICAHYYANGAQINNQEHSERLVVGGQDCINDKAWRKQASYIALGHIHKSQTVSDNVFYAGSILPMSFSEKYYTHGIRWVEIDTGGKMESTFIEYKPLRRLLSIPEKGAASPGEILKAIDNLPQKKQEEEDNTTWPYVEIRVKENQPEPQLLHNVMTALHTRTVHFCRMVREINEDYTNNTESQTPEELQKFSPLQMAERIFRQHYNEPIPDELRERLQHALEEVETAL